MELFYNIRKNFVHPKSRYQSELEYELFKSGQSNING